MAEARAKLKPLQHRGRWPPGVCRSFLQDQRIAGLYYPAAAAQCPLPDLGDAKSYAGFKARCDAAYLGELEPQWLVSAYEQAMGPKVRNRGTLFQTVCRRLE